MYDDLVKRIHRQAVYLSEKFSKNAELLDVLMKAADAIEELICEVADEHNTRLDAEERQRWIPVTERLPDKPGIYAVWTAKGFGNHLSTSCFDGDSWSLRITHWMPLPKPPKEET